MRDTAEEIQTLKKQVKKLKRTSGNVNLSALPQLESSSVEKECRELVSNSTSVFNTVNILLWKLFTVEEIISHSVPGKAANSKTAAKPKLDIAKMELLRSIVTRYTRRPPGLKLHNKFKKCKNQFQENKNHSRMPSCMSIINLKKRKERNEQYKVNDTFSG